MAIDTNVKLLRNRRTKIVATIGPGSNNAETLTDLIDAGVNVFRLNMSHGSHADHQATYALIRSIAGELEAPVAVLGDLCGPKIRVGRFPDDSIELATGEDVTVTTRDVVGAPGLIPSQYDALADDVEAGDRVLLDDGNLELSVSAVDGTEITCRVVHGGRLKNHKGMNLPGVNVSAPSLTDKDVEDANFALALGVDFLALSFVRRAADITALRELVSASGRRVAIIAKIEKPEALHAIDEILEATDGIMVARGDLGVELPPEEVPLAQAQLIDRARAANRPVIVATQMLESMIDNPRPTRAEVTDVANAVQSGADAVMLSAETAVGRHPRLVVEMMNDIARQTEGYLWGLGEFSTFHQHRTRERPVPVSDAIADTAALMSRELLVRAIMVASGNEDDTAAVLSASRPAAPLVVVTSDENAWRVANLLWGVLPMLIDPAELEQPRKLARRMTETLNLHYGEPTVLVVGGLSRAPGADSPSVTVVRL
jgi:pyruvate kinase